jgi:hypothetical protein
MSKYFVFFFFFLLGLLSCKSNKKVVSITSNKEVQIVLLAGQSNMAGAGNYDELNEDIKQRIKKISNRVSLSFNGKPAKPLSYYDNTPSEKYNFKKRFGPELLLGLTLAEANPNQEYLLIKRSQGGTSLYGAWSPNWTVEKAIYAENGDLKQKLKLYDLHITDIKNNIEVLKSKNKNYNIIGLAWMQGENDARKDDIADSYEFNLKNLIMSYRAQFSKEKMLIVIGQINSRYGVKDGAKRVRQAMENVSSLDNNINLIKTSTETSWSDFPKHSDNVHYNHEGLKRLGIAFAKALINLQ